MLGGCLWCTSHLHACHSWMIGAYLRREVKKGKTERRSEDRGLGGRQEEQKGGMMYSSGEFFASTVDYLNYYTPLGTFQTTATTEKCSTMTISEILYIPTPEFPKAGYVSHNKNHPRMTIGTEATSEGVDCLPLHNIPHFIL